MLMRAGFLMTLAVLAQAAQALEPVIGGPCEGCEAVFEGKPLKVPSTARIAPVGEKGEPLRLSGRVTGPDGNPRAGIIVYAYHTDALGLYPAPERSSGRASDRHGRLRGWASTDATGHYSFDTIRPASYPSRDIPAHIHLHVIEPGCATYYIDEIVFSDDPLLRLPTQSEQRRARGGSGLTHPRRPAPQGPWQIVRDIRLGLNVPGYSGCGHHLQR
jgi:protocatechuate 3,4-dioxygenase beta subunit